MLIYLPGPPGPEQIATKWLLLQRGYVVITAHDVQQRAKDQGDTDPASLMRRQAYEMLRVDAMVLEENVLEDTTATMELLKACRWMGVSALRYEDLPAQAPPLAMRDTIIAERDLLREDRQPVPATTWSERFAAMRSMVQRWADAFDRRWGWMLTNGNKQPAVRPYKLNTTKPLTTA